MIKPLIVFDTRDELSGVWGICNSPEPSLRATRLRNVKTIRSTVAAERIIEGTAASRTIDMYALALFPFLCFLAAATSSVCCRGVSSDEGILYNHMVIRFEREMKEADKKKDG